MSSRSKTAKVVAGKKPPLRPLWEQLLQLLARAFRLVFWIKTILPWFSFIYDSIKETWENVKELVEILSGLF